MHSSTSRASALIGLVFVLGLPLPAGAAGGFPSGPRPTLIGDTILLDHDQAYDIEALVVEQPTTIVLDGHDLTLTIGEAFEAKSPLAIRAIREDEPPPFPPPAPDAAPVGAGFNPGPQTSGNGSGEGRPGGTGGTGVKGADGLPGKPAGKIVLRLGANATVKGSLTIIASGGPGGKGGPGGAGGRGGNGEQGRPGLRDQFGFCSAGGARGGPAGDGGQGGPAGTGGKGGSGGLVVLQAGGSAEQMTWIQTISLDLAGGAGGLPGDAGSGGSAGDPGYGGMANGSQPFGCASEETTRMGEKGSPGLGGADGEPGATGDDAQLVVLD